MGRGARGCAPRRSNRACPRLGSAVARFTSGRYVSGCLRLVDDVGLPRIVSRRSPVGLYGLDGRSSPRSLRVRWRPRPPGRSFPPSASWARGKLVLLEGGGDAPSGGMPALRSAGLGGPPATVNRLRVWIARSTRQVERRTPHELLRPPGVAPGRPRPRARPRRTRRLGCRQGPADRSRP